MAVATTLLAAWFVAPGGVVRAAANEADAAALRISQAAIGQRVGDHRLVDSGGHPLRLADLYGRPVVVSFVFTNCVTACSGLTLHLREAVRVAREILGPGSFTVLTVGFDSPNDTPARMRAYGRDRGIVDADWRFAGGDAITLRRFTDATGFTWAPSATRGFDHVTQVTILDAGGTVVEQVYGEAFEPPQLVEPLRQLILEGSVQRTSVRGLIDRVRLYCSVYDPAAGRYRFDYSMLAAGLPALFVLGMVAWGAIALGRRRT
jgi:protein SCO1/2